MNRAESIAARATKRPRIELIDLARGTALIAMTIYHFCWDLAMFGLVDQAFVLTGAMVWFARTIASSFLFLVGFSLVLAHGNGIRWRSFAVRWLEIAAAAGLITLVTLYVTPDAFIFFGILHHIALASILGLAFLRAPWPLTLAAAALFTFGRTFLATHALDAPYWWWTGLSLHIPQSTDFVPIFPFFGAVLAGMAAATALRGGGSLAALARLRADARPARGLRFIGRHSLVYYLLHQPVMIGLLGGLLRLSGRIG